ncbi:hypothetical protein XELAEV_18003440mg [Xenopus laevis]|nr:hypothetical protein XELAEV_18003440mg [Xenopus laevis]
MNWENSLILCLVLGYIVLSGGAMLGCTIVTNPMKVLIYLTLFGAGSGLSHAKLTNPACHLKTFYLPEDYEYIQEGDLMVGGIVTVNIQVDDFTDVLKTGMVFSCTK